MECIWQVEIITLKSCDASQHLKSEATQLFVKQYKLISNKTQKHHITGPLGRESIGDWWLFLDKGPVMWRLIQYKDAILPV